MPENAEINKLLTAISQQNDQTAYKQLFILLHGRLLQFANSILKSEEDAREVVSDVFIRLWEKRSHYGSIESPLLYLYTCVKNQALGRMARLKRQQAISSETWQVQLSSIYFDPEKLFLTEEMIRQIRQAINDLPPRCRLIFKLVKEDGLKYREVADLLQVSIKTVEAQMAIAFRRIGKCMHLDIRTQEAKEAAKK